MNHKKYTSVWEYIKERYIDTGLKTEEYLKEKGIDERVYVNEEKASLLSYYVGLDPEDWLYLQRFATRRGIDDAEADNL